MFYDFMGVRVCECGSYEECECRCHRDDGPHCWVRQGNIWCAFVRMNEEAEELLRLRGLADLIEEMA